MLEAEICGANIVKQWNSQLDGNTRYTHRLLDGQIRELHEPFEVLGTKVVYPSAFGIASEDINCRCVIHQRARWALGEKELETLKHRAKKHGLQIGDKEYFEQVKVKDFEDFKREYIKTIKKLDSLTFDSTIASFVAAESIKDAEKYAKKFVDNANGRGLGISYKGMSVDSANAINEAFEKLYSSYSIKTLMVYMQQKKELSCLGRLKMPWLHIGCNEILW